MRRLFIIILSVVFAVLLNNSLAQKPKVCIISDGSDKNIIDPELGRHIGDPDDISAIASYLLMSNMFDTRAIVVSSTQNYKGKVVPNQKLWADKLFGEAYKKDLPELNKNIGGYQNEINFVESCIKENGERYIPTQKYINLDRYKSVKALFDEADKCKDTLNVLCWGVLTEQAILVNHCLSTNRTDVLNKIRFIAHWTNSSSKVGTLSRPDSVHNCFNDVEACTYMKNVALKGQIKYYECSAIGQYGIVEGGPKGKAYYNQFTTSALGTVFAEGKYITWKNTVDDSDCATYWVLLGNYGVSLKNIASNGTNPIATEQQNEAVFYKNASLMRNELLRRATAVTKVDNQALLIPNLLPEHGLTDAHSIIVDGRLYVVFGHDKSWNTDNGWVMDRWEIWSTNNLRDWKKENEILPKDTYIGDIPNCFAGDIISKNGKYYWYFSNLNINIGVMVADSPKGPFKDALGKPLLSEGVVPVRVYDPEVYEENGVYTIIFGAGHYYAATLDEDMISLASKPQPILVLDQKGKDMWTADKSCIFKRNGKYYLIWEEKYAMADNLRGPYKYMGESLKGGHCNVFEWDNQYYALLENKDIGLFYRGISLKPLNFNVDGTIIIPESDKSFPAEGRQWDFKLSTMAWHDVSGTTLEWDNVGKIKGKINGKAIIESAPWLCTDLKKYHTLFLTLKNNSKANKARISVASLIPNGVFWSKPAINWESEANFEFEISANDKEFKTYRIDLSKSPQIKSMLKRLRIEPAVNATKGGWEIMNISIE